MFVMLIGDKGFYFSASAVRNTLPYSIFLKRERDQERMKFIERTSYVGGTLNKVIDIGIQFTFPNKKIVSTGKKKPFIRN